MGRALRLVIRHSGLNGDPYIIESPDYSCLVVNGTGKMFYIINEFSINLLFSPKLCISISDMFVGEIIGQLCRCYGAEVFICLQEVLLSGIKLNLERDLDSSSDLPPQDVMEEETEVDERVRQ